jgi:hypothetical protein
MVSENVPRGTHRAPKLGSALLSGLLRCCRCGRKLTVQYTGARGQIPRYACIRGRLGQGEPSALPSAACAWTILSTRHSCLSYSLLPCKPHWLPRRRTTCAATMHVRRVRDLEAARYAADRAFRQYDAADPESRFVAGELERRWNRALTRVAPSSSAALSTMTLRPSLGLSYLPWISPRWPTTLDWFGRLPQQMHDSRGVSCGRSFMK